MSISGALSNGGTSTLYGVGFNYQLYELQQVYRHPRKIYELALTLANQSLNSNLEKQPSLMIKQPTLSGTLTKSSVSTSLSNLASNATSHQQQNLTVGDFYKNYVQPVLIPYHYCCSPLLFFPNWKELLVTEAKLKRDSTVIPFSSIELSSRHASQAKLPTSRNQG